MSTQTKNGMRLMKLLFGNNEYDEEITLSEELKQSLNSIKNAEKEVEKPLTTGKERTSNKLNLEKNINSKTIDAMRKIHDNKTNEKSNEEREL